MIAGQRHRGLQSIYDVDGFELFPGEWDPRAILAVLGPSDYWSGRRVLDLGSNTSGLSIELARLGARVIAAEPDPYKVTKARAASLLDTVTRRENLDITFIDDDLFECFRLRDFDTVLCLGLIYHFRNPQFILDSINAVTSEDVIVSTQTAPGEDLVLVNRMQPGVLKAGHLSNDMILSGWHPTRPMMIRMLKWAGFDGVQSLTTEEFNFPHKQKGLTNSAYFCARKVRSVDPLEEMRRFYPR